MTRALCTRSSKRKPAKLSQDIVPEDCKENSPLILSQSKKSSKKKVNNVIKNSSPRYASSQASNSSSVKTNREFHSPVRKSVRSLKSPLNNQNKLSKDQTERSVLCDKTNSPRIRENKPNEQNYNLFKTIQNKNTVYNNNVIAFPKHDENLLAANSCSKNDASNSKSHVPVYKTIGSIKDKLVSENLPPEKKVTVYEFEVDENEEPLHKKKRKKRIYSRKPKIGPKALTINNIKYSSSESLVSLPEKSAPQKKKAIKGTMSNLKPYSSVTSLNNSEDTCYSVKSFMSHPPLRLGENKNLKSKFELSVLQETQSEQYHSPHLPLNHLTISATRSPCSFSSTNTLAASKECNGFALHASPNPRCYISKKSHTPNISNNPDGTSHLTITNNTLSHQLSSCETNTSTASSRDFLSSTPCKRPSLVVRNNSVFDDSYDLPHGVRPSTGYIKDNSETGNVSNDNCFGFDEPEEIEEPLLSPIKNCIDLEPRKVVKAFPSELKSNIVDRPRPTPQEVIEMLKATIPKATAKESSTVFNTSSEQSDSSSPRRDAHKEIKVNFKKPPRRSYERQRRVRHYSDTEEESDEENSDKEVEQQPAPKVVAKEIKKCYKKTNTTKTAKAPKASKAKQKTAKEEEELERLAAQMNAQFEQIDKVNLVVE